MQAHVGCSGWFYWHWRGIFYPDTKRTDGWFKHYAANFHTVELNAPFYSWPKPATVKAWVRNSPENFRYSVKVNREITHERRLVRTRKLVAEFCTIANVLGSRLGYFLFQFPPSYKFTNSRLRSIISQIDPSFPCAMEFRHKSWWRASVFRAFEKRGLTFCTVSAPRLSDDLIRTSDAIYLRLHGRSHWYRHDYSSVELQDWTRKIVNSGAREAWIYFDNDREGFAIKNARALTGLLQKMDVSVV
jgi:uncharacterized protein YecE (DUF72 family)